MKLLPLIFVSLLIACNDSDDSNESGGFEREPQNSNTTDIVVKTNKLAGTTWTYSGSGWTYISDSIKKYQEDELTLIFGTDGTGTFENAFNNQSYVYNVITEKWQTGTHNVKDWHYTFSYKEPTGDTITLTNYKKKNDLTGTVLTITEYTGFSLVFNDHTFTKQGL